MKKTDPRILRRSVIVVGFIVAAGACTKKAAAPQPPPASPKAAGADKTEPAAAGRAAPSGGIDVAKLDPAKRKVFDLVVNREPSACGKGHSLDYSVKHDGACRASFYAVRYVARLADLGLSDGEIGDKLQQRFRTPRVAYIDVAQAPSKGSSSGRVKLVEFADYECGHCREAQSVVRALLVDYANDLTVYFKHFPLGGHVGSLNAALGAAAAQKQDKFWPFNDKVWASSEHLMPAVLEGIAKEIVGLDFQRWYEDVGSEEVRSHVQRDRTEGRALEIHRTPALFINGRSYTDELDLASLKDWIDEELGR
jgi:protein-disulfide isomerase